MKQLLVLSAFIVCGLFISCGDDDGEPAIVDLNLDAELVLNLVNEYRRAGAVCGEETKVAVSDLQWSDELALAALNHSNDMQVNNYFDHVSRDGRDFSQRAKESGYSDFPVAENIARGFQSEDRVISGWMGSPGHCKNIMIEEATHIGVARSDEDFIWTMVLGKE